MPHSHLVADLPFSHVRLCYGRLVSTDGESDSRESRGKASRFRSFDAPASHYLPVRAKRREYGALVERAETETDGNVSELVRRLMRYGLEHMPKDWNG